MCKLQVYRLGDSQGGQFALVQGRLYAKLLCLDRTWRSEFEYEHRGHSSSGGSMGDEDQFAAMNQMVHDAIWPSIDVPNSNSNTGNETFREDEEPNSEARHFYDTLISANQPIYEGATESRLSISVKLLAARSIWKVPQKGIDYFAQMLADVCPTKKCLPENNYQATQLVSKLGLKARKIDWCVNGCLL
jgi:hypothetical protein